MTARAADLTLTRDLLCARLRESGRILLSAGDVQNALMLDSKALRLFGDTGQIQFVAKGEKARGYTVEAVLDFIARGGTACPPIDQPEKSDIDTTSSCEVVAFTDRHTAPQKRRPTRSSAKPGPRLA